MTLAIKERNKVIEQCAKHVETKEPGTSHNWNDNSLFAPFIKDIAQRIRDLKEQPPESELKETEVMSDSEALDRANHLAHRLHEFKGKKRHPEFKFYQSNMLDAMETWQEVRLVFKELFSKEV